MKFLIIQNNVNKLSTFMHYVKNKLPIFVFFFLDGCGPCNMTIPEWDKLELFHLGKNALIIRINQTHIAKLKDMLQSTAPTIANALGNIHGFPAIFSIVYKNNDYTIEHYNGGRTVDAFTQWIKQSIGTRRGGGFFNKPKTRSVHFARGLSTYRYIHKYTSSRHKKKLKLHKSHKSHKY